MLPAMLAKDWILVKNIIKVNDFFNVSPWKSRLFFILIISNLIYPRKLFAKFKQNWPSGSREEAEI